MLHKNFVILGVAMLMAGACMGAAFEAAEYDIDVGWAEPVGYWEGAEYTYFTGTTGKYYLIEIVANNGVSSDFSGEETYNADEWLAAPNIQSSQYDFVFEVRTNSQVLSLAFYMFLYDDENRDGEWSVGEDLLDTAEINTY